jgi:flagellar motor component MotA
MDINHFEDMIMDVANKGELNILLTKITYFTFINFLSGCSETLKSKILDVFPEYKRGDLRRESDRISIYISNIDVLEAQDKVIRKITQTNFKKEMQDLGDNKQHYIHFKSKDKTKTLSYSRQIIISEKTSLDYNDFLKNYYNILWLLYSCRNMTKSCGLLELENYMIETLDENDFLCIGLRLIVSGETDATVKILLNKISREFNPFKKKLKQIALKGILAIQDLTDTPDRLILSLSDFSGIKDDFISKACVAYKKGDEKVFDRLFKKDSSLYNKMVQSTEREEITLTRRALEYQGKIRREGFESLDQNLLSKKDIFESGIYSIACGYKRNRIKRDLDKIIKLKKSSWNINFYQAQKEAVLSIIDGVSPYTLLEILLSYFDNDIAVIARRLFQKKYDF